MTDICHIIYDAKKKKKKWYIWAQVPATSLGFPKYMRSTHWPRVNHVAKSVKWSHYLDWV